MFRPEHDAEPDVLPAKQSMWICSKTTGHVEPRPYSVQVYIGLCLISKQNHILLVYYRYVIKLSVMWNKDYVLTVKVYHGYVLKLPVLWNKDHILHRYLLYWYTLDMSNQSHHML